MNPLWYAYAAVCVLFLGATFFSFSTLLRQFDKKSRLKLFCIIFLIEALQIYRTTRYEPLSACAVLCGLTAAALTLPLIAAVWRDTTIVKNGIHTTATATRINLGGTEKHKCTVKYSANYNMITIQEFPRSMLKGGMEADIWYSRENPHIYSSKGFAKRALISLLATLPISLALLTVFVMVVLRNDAYI